MFDGRCHDVLPALLVHLRDALDGQVAALGSARGEDDFAGLATDQGCDLFPSCIDRVLGAPAKGVGARVSVAEVL